MKYGKAFFAWFVGTAVIAGISMAVVPQLPIPVTYPDPQGASDTIVTAIVAIGMGIWVRRLLKGGVFGD